MNIAGVAAKVEGGVTLAIPAAQVQASVTGVIPLNISGSQFAATGVPAAGGRDPATGRFLPGAGGAAEGKAGKKSGKAGLDIGGQAGELQRVRTETEKYLREAVTAVDEVGDIVTTTHDSVEGIIRTSRKSVTGQKPLAAYREARRLVDENFKQLKAQIDPNDPGFGLAKLQRDQASQLRALTQKGFMGNIAAPQRSAIAQLLTEQANTLEAKSQATFRQALQTQVTTNFQKGQGVQRLRSAYWGQQFGGLTGGNAPLTGGARTRYQAMFGNLLAEQDLARYGMYSTPIGPQRQRMRVNLPPAMPAQATMQYPAPIGPQWGIKPPVEPPRRNTFERGLKHFTPAGFAANLLNVSGWAAAVGVLYKSMELAAYSLNRVMSIGQQTARLGQVFRSVGGSAQQLTDDVLQLASANGRSTEEAMHSATEWSRLGLTRKQVNEAVRVSMVAANVADMHGAETTKQLMSLSHIYNLRVGELGGVLGMLTHTSQNYNVTLEDLFQGLDRSAGAAKLARMSLAELQGLIAVGVGKTGQSGITVGNTIKSLLMQFSNPDVQKYLRQYGVETLTNQGGQKSGSQIMRDMAVRWQSLDARQQQSLTWRLVGRQSASRFTPLMEDYVHAQKLAIDSQLNLNRAQETNIAILATLKSQLAGVRSEFDRLVVRAAPNLSDTARFGKNLLRVLNEAVPAEREQPDFRKMSDRELRKYAGGQSGALSGTEATDEETRRWFGQRRQSGKTTGFWSWAFDRHTHGSLGQYLKYRYDSPFDLGRDELSGKGPRRAAAANAQNMRANLFEAVAAMMGSARDLKSESMRGNLDAAVSEMDPAAAAAFQKAMTENSRGGAVAVLKGQAAVARGQIATELRQQADEERNLYALATQQLNQTKAERAALEARGGAQDKINAKKQEEFELEKQLHELKSSSMKNDLAALESGTLEQVVELQQQYLNLLKEQEQVMGALEQLSAQGSFETAGGRLDSQVNALQQQLDGLKAERDRVHQEGGGVEADQVWARLTEQIKDRESQLAAMQSSRMREAVGMMDDRSIALRRAQEQSAGFAVGRTEADRLLEQERRLQRELQSLRSRGREGKLNENEAVRAKQMEIELWNTQEKIQMRIVDLARQEKQIRMDAQREFQKNLLLAGPAEQLQRLFVQRMAGRRGGVGSGEFNAMDPGAKRMFYDLMGGEPGAIVRQERARLSGRGLTVEQEQEAQRGARERVNGWNNSLGRFTTGRLGAMPAMPLPPSPLDAQARISAEAVGRLGSSATVAAQALGQIPQIVTSLVQQSLPKGNATPPPKVGISPGFALGGGGFGGNGGGGSWGGGFTPGGGAFFGGSNWGFGAGGTW
jgi:TP901 family phage tail tape measure protein